MSVMSGFRKSPKARLYTEDRRAQETPGEMVETLLGMIRGQFYGDRPAGEWFRDQNFIKREVVLWPASWLKKRGMVMDPVRYKMLIVEKLQDVKRNCAQGQFQYFPAYLARCIKDHFQHHEDTIYEECKALRGQLAAVVSKLRPTASGPDLVDSLCAARAVLKAGQKAKAKPVAKPADQLSLL